MHAWNSSNTWICLYYSWNVFDQLWPELIRQKSPISISQKETIEIELVTENNEPLTHLIVDGSRC